jgi:hypothetical protein
MDGVADSATRLSELILAVTDAGETDGTEGAAVSATASACRCNSAGVEVAITGGAVGTTEGTSANASVIGKDGLLTDVAEATGATVGTSGKVSVGDGVGAGFTGSGVA